MDQPISQQTLTRRHRMRLSVVVGALLCLGIFAWGINRVISPSVAMDQLHISEVRRGAIANTINAAGVVIPMHEEQVSSPIQTRVAHVRVKPGQEVAAGELLLELDDQTLRLAVGNLEEQVAQQENHVQALTLAMHQKQKQLASDIELQQLDLEAVDASRREHGATGGHVHLELEREDRRTRLSIIDSGDRLGDVPAGQMFTPFFTTKKGGQGIGLLFVREVLNRHGFPYRLAATGHGETRFDIWFGD